MGVDITEVDNLTLLSNEIDRIQPDIVIVNPLNLGIMQPRQLTPHNKELKYIALQNYIATSEQLRGYDAVISVSDNIAKIEDTIMNCVNSAPKDNDLSARERDVVKAIALGMSNKEIADSLFISAHTVMTHRKNITSKLKIHNSAGLTIYAIVNKLIDVGDVK